MESPPEEGRYVLFVFFIITSYLNPLSPGWAIVAI